MLNSTDIENYLNQLISRSLGLRQASLSFRSVGGGSINETYQVTANNQHNFFLKLNSAIKFPGLFRKETEGLNFLGNQNVIRVPKVIACNEIEGIQILF